jgi:hypothetical protein
VKFGVDETKALKLTFLIFIFFLCRKAVRGSGEVAWARLCEVELAEKLCGSPSFV